MSGIVCKLFSLAGAVLLGVYSSHTHAALTYSVTDLGFLQGFGAYDVSINNSGQIATSNGYLYSNGQWQYIGDLGGTTPSGTTSVRAFDMNNSGQVVGVSSTPNGSYRAFIYDGGAISEIGGLGDLSSADGINDPGDVVGTYKDGLNTRAYLYHNGLVSDLGTLGANFSTANAINDAGQVVGSSLRTDGLYHAYVYANGSMTDLGTLGGAHSGANDINSLGQVVGGAQVVMGGSDMHAFLYSEGMMMDLGTLGGWWAAAMAINDQSQIVGSSFTGAGQSAFLFADGVMLDLNGLIGPGAGWELNTASSINDNGEIVGIGRINGETRAYLLTPVPLPGAGVLLLSGVLSLLPFLRLPRVQARLAA